MTNALANAGAVGQEPFVVSSIIPPEGPPRILNHRQATGVDAPGPAHVPLLGDPASKFGDAALYLQEGIRRMTGVTLNIENTDLTGTIPPSIIFTLLPKPLPNLPAPPDPLGLTTDLFTVTALTQGIPAAHYQNHEAYVIRIEPQLLVLVANSVDGLACAVADLLETVGYEVLGMGPNWAHVPRLPNNTVTFPPPAEVTATPAFTFQPAVAGQPGYYFRASRPSFFLRMLSMSYADSERGTIFAGDPHPRSSELAESDELMQASYARWQIGTRTRWPFSLPLSPSHVFGEYHDRVVRRMIVEHGTEGFLNPIHTEATLPAAGSPGLQPGDLWINGLTLTPGSPTLRWTRLSILSMPRASGCRSVRRPAKKTGCTSMSQSRAFAT